MSRFYIHIYYNTSTHFRRLKHTLGNGLKQTTKNGLEPMCTFYW